jgi:hypothetical protein
VTPFPRTSSPLGCIPCTQSNQPARKPRFVRHRWTTASHTARWLVRVSSSQVFWTGSDNTSNSHHYRPAETHGGFPWLPERVETVSFLSGPTPAAGKVPSGTRMAPPKDSAETPTL